jgi:hypothetical protein
MNEDQKRLGLLAIFCLVVGLHALFVATTIFAGAATNFEDAAVWHDRESRRASLGSQLGRLLEQLGQETPRQRLAWQEAHRGRLFLEPTT